MKTYQIGETVVLKATIKKSGALYDPVTSVVISVYLESSTTALSGLSAVAVTKETTGIYPYNLTTTGQVAGKYRFRFLATDGTKITKKDGSFKLEA